MATEIDLTNARAVKQHVSAMIATPGYHVVLQFLNIDREAIIEAGKKARATEKQMKNWAVLEGFDQVIKRITQLANLPIEEEPEEPSEE